jgi:hypothetical protein
MPSDMYVGRPRVLRHRLTTRRVTGAQIVYPRSNPPTPAEEEEEEEEELLL